MYLKLDILKKYQTWSKSPSKNELIELIKIFMFETQGLCSREDMIIFLFHTTGGFNHPVILTLSHLVI